MNELRSSQLPPCDANGNAGTHPPEKEIYYQAVQALDQKNSERLIKG